MSPNEVTLPREPKPLWKDVPPELKRAVEEILAGKIIKGEIAWGGYTPSANFQLNLEDGRKIFCKGVHSGQTEVGKKAFQAELLFFEGLPWIKDFTPRFRGHCKASGWEVLLFDFITDREDVPPWSEAHTIKVLERLSDLHSLNTNKDHAIVPHISENEFSKGLYFGMDTWGLLKDEHERKAFSEQFEDPVAVKGWLEKHHDRILEIETSLPSVTTQEAFIHVDLRSDNILFSREQGLKIVDWPQLTVGPVILDLAFFAPSVAAEGGPSPEEFIRIYERVSGMRFSTQEILAATTLTAGFFAARAHLPPMVELPRLRWIQKKQLFPAVQWMVRLMDPASSGHFKERNVP